jgi:methyltransferase (TIGR00027 family)
MDQNRQAGSEDDVDEVRAMEDPIGHVGDTALLAAACRAIESARPDSLVCDPLAEKVAGVRGMAMAHSVSMFEWVSLGVVLRARLMDELLKDTSANRHVQTVLNLGAGLDTRPWRLELPAGLRWIEADSNAILDYKSAKLAREEPHCHLEQVAADLASPGDRESLFARVGSARALMITEGLLAYLPSEVTLGLAAQAPRLSGIRYWLLDVHSHGLMRLATGAGLLSSVDNLFHKDRLEGEAVLDAVKERGWRVSAKRTFAREIQAVARERVAKMHEAARQAGKNLEPPEEEVSGVYLFEQTMA